MPVFSEDDEIALPLVRRREDPATTDEAFLPDAPMPEDRMGTGTSGGIAGLFAGAAALGVVHLMTPSALVGTIARAASQWSVDMTASFTVAYVTAAAIGALIGAGFAGVTRYLRRWFPLLIWALVFFVSLTLLLLALSRTYGRGIGVPFAPAILAASAAYAFVVSFSLPLRKKA